VRSTEIDINGHVNNAKYIEYLEWGRDAWYDQHDLEYDDLLEEGIQTVTVNLNANYRKECKLGEVLTIETRALTARRSSYVMEQIIRKQDGTVAMDANITLVTMDKVTRKSRTMPERMRAHFPTR
jgi:YbgC/YbaW family acyl-CoA thioester hydrolase